MFHIEARFEDTQITAASDSGHTYSCVISDVSDLPAKETSRRVELSARHLSMILQFCLDPDGTPPGFEDYYKELEPIFKGWPQNLRPIP